MIDLNKWDARAFQAEGEMAFVEISPHEMKELIALVKRQEAELAAARAALDGAVEINNGYLREIDGLIASLPAAGAVLTNDQREAVIEALASALGDAYDCTRVWSAWSYGTMGPDDFSTISQDGARLSEIAEAVIAAMPAAQPAPSAAPIPAQPVARLQLMESDRPFSKGEYFDIIILNRDLCKDGMSLYASAPAQAAAPDTRITEQVKSWRAEIARLTDLIAHATGDAAPDAQPGLHAAIMNLRCKTPDYSEINYGHYYRIGHRDARHAAAELVAAAPDAQPDLTAQQIRDGLWEAIHEYVTADGELMSGMTVTGARKRRDEAHVDLDALINALPLAAAQPEAKAAPAKDEKLPTDLSQRLRAKACKPFGPEDFALLTQAADEIERYHGGMMNWKANAQQKDCQMAEYREQLAAAKSAAPAPATLNNEQIVAIWNKANTPSIENGWTTGPLPFAHALLAAAGNSQGLDARWISVAERMPEVDARVLVYEAHCSAPFVGYHDGKEWDAETEHHDCHGGWDGCVVHGRVTQSDITHWMPLPAAPVAAPVGGSHG